MWIYFVSGDLPEAEGAKENKPTNVSCHKKLVSVGEDRLQLTQEIITELKNCKRVPRLMYNATLVGL